jgi:hypothetical protein
MDKKFALSISDTANVLKAFDRLESEYVNTMHKLDDDDLEYQAAAVGMDSLAITKDKFEALAEEKYAMAPFIAANVA